MVRLVAFSAVLALSALPVLANEAAIEARQGNMQTYALNLGVLGSMAQGRTAYDAALAQEAADNLFHMTRNTQLGMWPEGSDNGAVSGTRALPAIWANNADFLTAYANLQTAAQAMQAAAGTDLAGLQGAMAGVGGACQACHQTFRAP